MIFIFIYFFQNLYGSHFLVEYPCIDLKLIDLKKNFSYVAPTHYLRDKLCLLRSGFANKNCRVQYEVRTYYRYMTFHNLTGSTADTFLEYIERNLPEGIAMKVTKVSLVNVITILLLCYHTGIISKYLLAAG